MAAQRFHLPAMDQVVTRSCYHPSTLPSDPSFCQPCICCILSRERVFVPSREIYSGPIDGWPEVDHGSDSESTGSTHSLSDDPEHVVHLRHIPFEGRNEHAASSNATVTPSDFDTLIQDKNEATQITNDLTLD